ncbi:MAG: O-antigen ligase family protein [Thermoguttaceae bacterium]
MISFASSSNFLSPTAEAWRLWLAIIALGGVFFFVFHDPHVSQYAEYAPWSAAAEVKAAGGNAIKGAALAMIGLLGVYFLLEKQGRKLNLHSIIFVLMLFYVVWAALSITWSIGPWLTARHTAVLCFCFLGALGIARQLSQRQLALTALIVTAAYLALGLCAELVLGTFRPWAGGYRFSGTVHPNTQGLHLSVLCLSAFLLAKSTSSNGWRKALFALFAVGFVFLLLTKSRTALAGFILAISALWFLRATTFNRALAIVAALFTACALLLVCSFMNVNVHQLSTDAITLGRADEVKSLTGRLPIWHELLHYVGQHPLVGYGYESFWTPEHIEDLSETMQWRFREAHSGFIESVLSVGLIGAACLFSVVMIGLITAAVKYSQTKSIGYGMTLGLLLMGLVSAAFESGMTGENFVSLLTACCIMHLFCFRERSFSN